MLLLSLAFVFSKDSSIEAIPGPILPFSLPRKEENFHHLRQAGTVENGPGGDYQ